MKDNESYMKGMAYGFQDSNIVMCQQLTNITFFVILIILMCFVQKTWQRLRTVDILHDAIPHPHDRLGHPMHVKVRILHFF